jgi:hypothetical protein
VRCCLLSESCADYLGHRATLGSALESRQQTQHSTQVREITQLRALEEAPIFLFFVKLKSDLQIPLALVSVLQCSANALGRTGLRLLC